MLAVTREAYGEEDEGFDEEIGIAIPATMAVLGLAFLGCALVVAGLPPLSGFIAKFALLSAALDLPVLVRNDANAAVLAEYTFGQARPDMLLIRIGRGVGAGLITDSQPLIGRMIALLTR